MSNKTLLESLSAENEVCISNLEHFAPNTKRTVFAHLASLLWLVAMLPAKIIGGACDMKTEMDITYIFVRYITVTLKRQAKAFYKNQGKIFSHESKELAEFSKNEQSKELWLNKQRFIHKEIFEMNFEKERFRLSLSYLTNQELFILSEKFSKKLSDVEIGKKFHVSSQMIFRKKRTVFAKLKERFLF